MGIFDINCAAPVYEPSSVQEGGPRGGLVFVCRNPYPFHTHTPSDIIIELQIIIMITITGDHNHNQVDVTHYSAECLLGERLCRLCRHCIAKNRNGTHRINLEGAIRPRVVGLSE